MKQRNYGLSLMLLFTLALDSWSQPTDIFDGGDGQGYGMIEKTSQVDHLYSGGDYVGYATAMNTDDQELLYTGGDDDGYGYALDHSAIDHLYSGADNDGYAIASQYSGVDIFYNGAEDDGYTYVLYREPFIWTGATGTGWTVTSNWNYNVIPDILRPVIIAAAVPNYPYVNSGLLSIGADPNGGGYLCASLWIQEDALLVTRVNIRVENYGNIIIDGEMWIKKLTDDAFKNFEEGNVLVTGTGLFTIKP